MQTLIIYDKDGYIISTRAGSPAPRTPKGVPFIWTDIPDGKQITSVDVSKTTHTPVLEDVPLSELDVLKQTVADLTEIVLSGGK